MSKSNIVFLIPTGHNPEYPAEHVLVWCDKKSAIVFKVDFHEPIKSLNFTNDLYIVVKQNSIVCMKLNNKPLREIETCVNNRGLCAVAHDCTYAPGEAN